MRYHLVVLGCQMNISDSERVKSVIEGMGYTYTDSEDEADMLGIISCSVRQKPIDRAYGRIHKWNRIKNKRNVITFVSGCVLPDDKKKFLKLFDFVFDMSELNDYPNMLKEYGIVTPISLQHSLGNPDNEEAAKPSVPIAPKLTLNRANLKPIDEKSLLPSNKHILQLWNVKPHYESDFEAFVPIQNGCDKYCSYCAVPYTRGREVSRPSNDVVAEVKILIEKGYKSITLLGQNVNSYGLDNKDEISFAELLEQIGQLGDELKQKCWIYFTSPHPRDMSRDVVEAISKYDIFGKQIHLPLQSGSDQVLIKMNRKYNVDRYRESIAYIKELVPQATIFTDIIVGFTGETEEQFMQTMDSFDEFQFNMGYIAMYSPRPGAKSFKWIDDIPKDTKKDRFQRLTEKLKSISGKYNHSLIGKEMDVLVRTTERKTGYLSGHNEGKIVTRVLSKDTDLIGQIVKGRVIEASGFSITIELI